MTPAILELFHDVAANVPAYAEYLAEHGVDPATVDESTFGSLPLMTKADYVRRYRLAQRMRGGDITGSAMVAVSSGSTGVPTYWPRRTSDEVAMAERFRQIFDDALHSRTVPTLAVICFPLGTWVGGMFTTACIRMVADNGSRIMTVTPGNNVEEILRVVADLAPQFEQTVLCGYPPFLKGVVDLGRSRGFDWASMNPALVMAGEVFTEEWRSLMGERLGITDVVRRSSSLYGTADAGVLGNETPLSVTIRRWFAENPDHAAEWFGESRLPTLVQFNPAARFIECVDGTLALSGDSGVPLIRYHIADTGGVAAFDDLIAWCRRHGFDPLEEVGTDAIVHVDPFTWVFGRSDFTVSFYGANVFPENVAIGLEQQGLREWVTGKFVMQIRSDDDQDRRLHITVELAPGQEPLPERAAAAAASIRTHVERVNSEFAHYVPDERRTPLIDLKPHGDPDWFPVGVKHRYTRA